MALVGAAIGLVTTALGIWQKAKSDQALAEIEKEKQAQFDVSPELRTAESRATERVRQPIAPAEEAAFRSDIARTGATKFQRAKDIGGGRLSSAVQAGIKAEEIGAINEFAKLRSDRGVLAQRQADQIALRIQQQKNIATESQISERQRREEAFGTAGAIGLENIIGGITTGLGLGAGSAGTAGVADELAPIGTSQYR